MKKIKLFKDNNSIDKRIVAIYIIVIFFLILGISYALEQSSISFNATTREYGIAYESNFDTSNLQFSPIIDDNLEMNKNNIIKIDFKVGGVENNPNLDIIYDIALVDLSIDPILKSNYIKWKLIKDNIMIANGDFKDIGTTDRLVLTGTQQDLPTYTDPQDNYTFYLWFSDSCQNNITECSNAEDQTYMLNKTISGKIEVELYTGKKKNKTIMINFDANGGDITTNSKTVTYNTTYGELPTPTRVGYTFIGWFANEYKDHPLYYYADTYPELKEKIGYNEIELYNHYLNTGKTENKRIAQYLSTDKVEITTTTTLHAGWIKNY